MPSAVRVHWGRLFLPGIHLGMCVIAFITSLKTPGGTWYVLIPFDPVFWPFMFRPLGDLSIFALLATLGTAQWYLISRVIELLITLIRKLNT